MTLPRYYRHNTEVLPLYSGLLHCLCTVFTVGRPVLLPAVSFTASIEFDQFYCFKLKRTCSVQFAVVRRFCFGFVCVPQLLQGTATATGRLTAVVVRSVFPMPNDMKYSILKLNSDNYQLWAVSFKA